MGQIVFCSGRKSLYHVILLESGVKV